jgi:hypothetical protein
MKLPLHLALQQLARRGVKREIASLLATLLRVALQSLLNVVWRLWRHGH